MTEDSKISLPVYVCAQTRPQSCFRVVDPFSLPSLLRHACETTTVTASFARGCCAGCLWLVTTVQPANQVLQHHGSGGSQC
mmetsp:Transcript_27404/g.59940  ORF Transcript_27404/g.59940 Transcript_27404/m.59940 type:complete len:81 (+) Transcript_27404:751-993(+)